MCVCVCVCACVCVCVHVCVEREKVSETGEVEPDFGGVSECCIFKEIIFS